MKRRSETFGGPPTSPTVMLIKSRLMLTKRRIDALPDLRLELVGMIGARLVPIA